ncbi:hypothetical protein KDL29_02850 [bacterium]|nr:hypothetical protein [bacterium]
MGSIAGGQLAIQSQQLPSSLPGDGVQPWESLDTDGHVIPAERSSSSININSDFTPGVERFLDSGDAADNLEATRLNGSDDSGTSYAMYRVSMSSEQPGIVSVDANLLSGKGYIVGLSNYGSGRWDWHGPFTDNHVRLQAATDTSALLTSPFGNTLVTVLCPAGSSADVVGIGVNQFDLADATAPATPLGLTATPVSGGLLLEWSPVLDSDLAGYVIHYATRAFTNPDSAGVHSVSYLEGTPRHLLTGLDSRTYVRVSSVDFSSNRSAASDIVNGNPLTGDALPVQLVTDAVSGGVDADITLAASGAASYDWDLDGDGVFEIEDDLVGIQQADTSATGIIRPRVRGVDSDAVALGGVSLVITGNTRPVASAVASPQFGDAPLDVTFSGSAEDNEDAVEELTFAWDFDGDGIYEDDTDTLTPAQQTYSTPGLYNVKFHATDSDGAWDVDTVTVSAGDNLPPHAAFSYVADGLPTPFTARFDATGCLDIDGSIALLEWDWDADGTYDEDSGTDPYPQHDFQAPGFYTVNLRVTDNQAASSVASSEVLIFSQHNEPPVADLQADKLSVEKGEVITFTAANSQDPDGSIVSYQWDLNGNMAFNESGNGEDLYEGSPTAQVSWSDPGIKKVSVLVLDDQGAGGFASLEPVVHGWVVKQLFSWGIFTMLPDTTASVDLCEVNGRPAIAVVSDAVDDVRYIRANDSYGVSWPADPVSVESDANVDAIGELSLKVVAGHPALAFYNVSANRLSYVRALDADGDSWGGVVQPDPGNGSGTTNDLAIVNGNPAICFQFQSPTALKYVRALDPTGQAWGTPVTVDSGGAVSGDEPSMAIVDGFPAITSRRHGGASQSLRYCRAQDADGSAWNAPVDATPADSSGYQSTLLVLDGIPSAINKDGTGEVSFLRALDPLGSTWDAAAQLNPSVLDGYRISMAAIGGKPAIVSRADSGGNVMYTPALDSAGTSWGTSVAIGVGEGAELISLQGRPAITYIDYNLDNPSFVYYAIRY